MRNHPLATAAIAIAASAALLAAAFAGSTGLVTVLAIAVVVPVSALVAGRFLRGAGCARPPQGVSAGATPTSDPTGPRSDADPSVTAMIAGFVAAILLITGGGVVGLAAHGDLDHSTMMGGAGPGDHMAFMLDAVPGDIASHYTFAREHRGLFSMIPCYCGCEATLDHRHLYDCFVRPDGRWESHASGCAVCIDESKMARRMLRSGVAPAAVRDAIVARYEALIPD